MNNNFHKTATAFLLYKIGTFYISIWF